jgi:hypothetical protein
VVVDVVGDGDHDHVIVYVHVNVVTASMFTD